MTVLVRHCDPFMDNVRWIVNGCLTATMTRHDAVALEDFKAEAIRRVTPLVWLAMPGHDQEGAPSDG